MNSSSDSPGFGPSGSGWSPKLRGSLSGLPGPDDAGAGTAAGFVACAAAWGGAFAENWSRTSDRVSRSRALVNLHKPSRSSKSGSESSVSGGAAAATDSVAASPLAP